MRFLLYWLDLLWFEFGAVLRWIAALWQRLWLLRWRRVREWLLMLALIPVLVVLFPIVLLCGLIGALIEGPQPSVDRRVQRR